MNVDEDRSFKIDVSLKHDCQIQPNHHSPNTIEIRIKKTRESSQSWKFQVMEEERNPSLTCNPGNYHLDIDRISVGCGIAQVLIQLCLNENSLDFHNVFNKYILLRFFAVFKISILGIHG